jgi:hypothetical protein
LCDIFSLGIEYLKKTYDSSAAKVCLTEAPVV